MLINVDSESAKPTAKTAAQRRGCKQRDADFDVVVRLRASVRTCAMNLFETCLSNFCSELSSLLRASYYEE